MGAEAEGQPFTLQPCLCGVSRETKGDFYWSLLISSMVTFTILFLLFLIFLWCFKREEGKEILTLLFWTRKLPQHTCWWTGCQPLRYSKVGVLCQERNQVDAEALWGSWIIQSPFQHFLPRQPSAEPSSRSCFWTTDPNLYSIQHHLTHKESWIWKAGEAQHGPLYPSGIATLAFWIKPFRGLLN